MANVHDMQKADQYFSHKLTISVLLILLCMTCMVSSTVAWYTADVTGGSNRILAANFDFEIEDLTHHTEIQSNVPVRLAAGAYQIRLTMSGDASCGFGRIITYDVNTMGEVLGEKETYCTAPLVAAEGEADSEVLEFTLVLPKATTLTLVPVWGTYTGVPHVAEEDDHYIHTASDGVATPIGGTLTVSP